jgi:hypothetical protein
MPTCIHIYSSIIHNINTCDSVLLKLLLLCMYSSSIYDTSKRLARVVEESTSIHVSSDEQLRRALQMYIVHLSYYGTYLTCNVCSSNNAVACDHHCGVA